MSDLSLGTLEKVPNAEASHFWMKSGMNGDIGPGAHQLAGGSYSKTGLE